MELTETNRFVAKVASLTESVCNMKVALDNKMDKEQDELDKRQISASFLEVERGHIHLHIRHIPILSDITSKVGEALEDSYRSTRDICPIIGTIFVPL